MNYFYFDEGIEYPMEPPYDPGDRYPEYPFEERGGQGNNTVYAAIRDIFYELGYDSEHYAAREWNPLGIHIQEGQTVLLKPNMVCHNNPAENDPVRGMDCLVTHPSIVRCIFDYVYIALRGKGRIIIADAPIQGCDFDKLLRNTGYGELFRFLKAAETGQLKVDFADLREVTWRKEGKEIIQEEREKPDFPGISVNLKEDSYFDDIDNRRSLRITCYDGADTVSHHGPKHNEYKISSAVLCADVIISIPKPKSHRIAGYTAALKNMIGANARKEYLPHHRKGSFEGGADEYEGSHRLLKWINSTSKDFMNHAVKTGKRGMVHFFDEVGRRTGRKLNSCEPDRYVSGMWYGNDTIWRTILDVNHAVLYADKEGIMKDEPQRKILYIGDMVACGDHEGPLNPTYKRVGGILFSENAVEFDMIVVKLMGFDWEKFKVLKNAVLDNKLAGITSVHDIMVKSNQDRFNGKVSDITDDFGFAPTKGWQGYL